MTLKNGTSLDGYLIQDCLSTSGGMSAVYLAERIETKRTVALKVAITDPNPNAAAHEDVLLQREAELLQRSDLRHSGIVRLYPIPLKYRKPLYVVRASSLSENPWYVSMEYLGGGSLKDSLKKISKYSVDWKLELFYQILLPISFLHSKGYAHRDIKPDNIMFRTPLSDKELPAPVFIDFALATNGDEYSSIVMDSYTPGYAAPERIINAMPTIGHQNEIEDVKASDIWSLGVILYEILTGKILYKGTKEKVKTTIIREKINPKLPIAGEQGITLGKFIQSMLNKDAKKRPDVDLVITALEHKFLPPHL